MKTQATTAQDSAIGAPSPMPTTDPPTHTGPPPTSTHDGHPGVVAKAAKSGPGGRYIDGPSRGGLIRSAALCSSSGVLTHLSAVAAGVGERVGCVIPRVSAMSFNVLDPKYAFLGTLHTETLSQPNSCKF